MNKNKNTIYQNLWGAAKAVFRGNFIAVNNYIKEGSSQINNLTFLLKVTEKEEQTKPTLSRIQELIKIRVDINKTENRKIIESPKSKVYPLKRSTKLTNL